MQLVIFTVVIILVEFWKYFWTDGGGLFLLGLLFLWSRVIIWDKEDLHVCSLKKSSFLSIQPHLQMHFLHYNKVLKETLKLFTKWLRKKICIVN